MELGSSRRARSNNTMRSVCSSGPMGWSSSDRARKMRSNASGFVGRSPLLRALSMSVSATFKVWPNSTDNLLLPSAEIVQLLVKAVCPKMRPGLRGDELCVHTQRVAKLAHAALKRVAHADFIANLAHIDGLTLIRVGDSRAMTNMPGTRERSVVTSSVMPSAR